MKDHELVLKVEAEVKHLQDGSCSESELIEKLAESIFVDVAAEKRRKAKAMVDGVTKLRSTRSDGQLALPGFNEVYGYEPDRLIRGDNGRLVRQAKAAFSYKNADAERALKHSEEAAHSARIKGREAALFGDWSVKQALAGRPEADLSFDNFVRETGIRIDAESADAA